MSDEQMMRLMLALRNEGIMDRRLTQMIEHTPRPEFVPRAFARQAWDDVPLPIACGQSISPPSVVARMTQALEVPDRAKVLEIGTGSGYQTAILSQLCRRVYSLEVHKPLYQEATQRLTALGYENVVTKLGNGHQGWAEQAPFDRIIATASYPEAPRALLDQLRDGGLCVLAIGPTEGPQELRVYKKAHETVTSHALGSVTLSPMLSTLSRGQTVT